MATRAESIYEHRKKYGVTYMINFFGSILPVATLLGVVYTQFGTIVTEPELVSRIKSHETVRHTELEKTVNSIYLLNLQTRIEAQIRTICENPNLRTALEQTINALIRDYNAVSDIPYIRPSCLQLGVV